MKHTIFTTFFLTGIIASSVLIVNCNNRDDMDSRNERNGKEYRSDRNDTGGYPSEARERNQEGINSDMEDTGDYHTKMLNQDTGKYPTEARRENQKMNMDTSMMKGSQRSMRDTANM